MVVEESKRLPTRLAVRRVRNVNVHDCAGVEGEKGNQRMTCSICSVDGHSVCWDVEPDIECSCCVETMKQMLIEDMEKGND